MVLFGNAIVIDLFQIDDSGFARILTIAFIRNPAEADAAFLELTLPAEFLQRFPFEISELMLNPMQCRNQHRPVGSHLWCGHSSSVV